MGDDLLLERKNGIATVTLNRPERRNAISYDGWQELSRVAEELGKDAGVRAVVLTGAGGAAFSAGADIKDFEEHRSDSKKGKVYAEAYDGAFDAFEALPQPTISLIRGFCIGGGCELALATDIRIAADNSRFGIPAARLGLLVGYQEMRRLVDLVGPGNASYLLLSAHIVDAQEALRIGLATRVVPLGEIEEYTYGLAGEMASLAPLSHKRHKRILRTVLANLSLAGLTPEEEALPFANFDSEDFRTGRMAFQERRTPEFKGR